MSRKGFQESVALVDEASKGKQFFIMEDFDHRVVKNKEFVASKEVITTLADNNYKHFALEISRSQQPAVDNYINGKLSRDDFVKEMSFTNSHLKGNDLKKNGEAMAQLVDNARHSGMPVHCIDNMTPDTIVLDLTQGLSKNMTIGELRNKLKDAVDVCNELDQYPHTRLTCDNKLEAKQFQAALDLVNKVGGSNEAQVATLQGKIKTYADSRADGDKEVVEYLASRIKKGEAVAIMFGAGHAGYRDGSGGLKDLDEHLSAKGSVGRVGLAGDSKVPERYADKGYEMPNALIYTDKGWGAGRYEAKVYNPEYPAGGELNPKNDPGFDVDKYQNYKPRQNEPEKHRAGANLKKPEQQTPVADNAPSLQKADFEQLAGNVREQLANKGVEQKGQEITDGVQVQAQQINNAKSAGDRSLV